LSIIILYFWIKPCLNLIFILWLNLLYQN